MYNNDENREKLPYMLDNLETLYKVTYKWRKDIRVDRQGPITTLVVTFTRNTPARKKVVYGGITMISQIVLETSGKFAHCTNI